MKKNIKKALIIASVIGFSTSISSCNRGYGCPNNFSLKMVTEMAQTTVHQIVAVIR